MALFITQTGGGCRASNYIHLLRKALEKAELLQFHLVETLKIMFPEWSYGEYLDLHAKRVALERRAAGYAYAELEIEGIAGTVIPAGFAFAVPSVNSQPAIEFRTMEAAEIAEDGKAAVGVLAVLPGTSGNVPADAIVLMVSPMRGITAIKNPEKASGGTEEESDDSLRARIMEIEQGLDTGFVGCDADYIRSWCWTPMASLPTITFWSWCITTSCRRRTGLTGRHPSGPS